MTESTNAVLKMLLVIASVFVISGQSARADFNCAKAMEQISDTSAKSVGSGGQGQPGADRAQLRAELNNLFSVIEHQYGPLQMKQKSIGMDWTKTKADYLKQLDGIKTTEEYYFLVAKLLHQFNDAHVSISLPTTLVYSLPLQMVGAEGHIIVNYVDGSYPETARKPEIGDRLVGINGMSPKDFQKLSPYFNKNGNDITNATYFALTLARLQEKAGISLSKMPEDIKFTFESYVDGKTYDVALKFKKEGSTLIGKPVKKLANDPTNQNFDELTDAQLKAFVGLPESAQLTNADRERIKSVTVLFYKVHKLFNMQSEMAREMAPEGQEAPKSLGKKVQLGDVTPMFELPSDFQKIQPPAMLAGMLNANNFYAGTFTRNGQKVGYLRIPSYMPENIITMLPSIRFYIGRLQAESDVLVIDQLNNPGGAVVFADLLIKSLTGTIDDSKHLKFAVKPTQGFMRNFVDIMDTIKTLQPGAMSDEAKAKLLTALEGEYAKIHKAYVNGDALSEPISLAVISEFYETIIEESVAKIKPILTALSSKFLGLDVFTPQVYTKPVYFLINELDFSGGDATPAMFQDYGRGKLVGVRTAGAGGTVEEFQHRNSTEFSYRLTTSLMVRKNGDLVENYGVKPDINFNISEQDYRDGFKTALDRLLKTLGL